MNLKKLFFLSQCIAYLFLCQQYGFAQDEISLSSGKEFTYSLSSGSQHTYTIELRNGMALIGEISNDKNKLIIDVYEPDGSLLKQIKSPSRGSDSWPINFTAKQSGKYKLIISTEETIEDKVHYTFKVVEVLTVLENTKRITKSELPTASLFKLWETSLTDKNSIENFIKEQHEKHIIEPIKGDSSHMLVTYFCAPPANIEYVMLSGGPDFLGLRFQQLPGTEMHFVTQRVPKDARFNYGFNYFTIDKAGPNKEIEYRGFQHAYDGVLEMPAAPSQNYIEERMNVAKGNIQQKSLKSEILAEDRKISIHTPANYDATKPHHLLIVFDGETYGARPNRNARIPAPTILDNLTAENKIPPTVTILVWSMGQRSKDLISEKFGDFIAAELIPWARSSYNIYPDKDKVILAGSSRGGYAAAYIAFRYPKLIGNVLSQSGSYWIKGTKDENHWIYPEQDGKLITAYLKSDPLPIRFYMDVGLYDAGASMLGMNRQFRDILRAKAYTVDYREFKGGHSYINWRGTLSDGLISLMGQHNN